jgi:hypothetical protein
LPYLDGANKEVSKEQGRRVRSRGGITTEAEVRKERRHSVAGFEKERRNTDQEMYVVSRIWKRQRTDL